MPGVSLMVYEPNPDIAQFGVNDTGAVEKRVPTPF
jgi:hypothetical protein